MIRVRLQPEKRTIGTLVVTAITMSLVSTAAWLTHVVVCIKTTQWLFLVAGAVAFPAGVVHGLGIWFGVW